MKDENGRIPADHQPADSPFRHVDTNDINMPLFSFQRNNVRKINALHIRAMRRRAVEYFSRTSG